MEKTRQNAESKQTVRLIRRENLILRRKTRPNAENKQTFDSQEKTCQNAENKTKVRFLRQEKLKLRRKFVKTPKINKLLI